MAGNLAMSLRTEPEGWPLVCCWRAFFSRLILCIGRRLILGFGHDRSRRSWLWWQVGWNGRLLLHCLLQLSRFFPVDLLPPAVHLSLAERLFYLWLYRPTLLQLWRWGHYLQLITCRVNLESPLIF